MPSGLAVLAVSGAELKTRYKVLRFSSVCIDRCDEQFVKPRHRLDVGVLVLRLKMPVRQALELHVPSLNKLNDWSSALCFLELELWFASERAQRLPAIWRPSFDSPGCVSQGLGRLHDDIECPRFCRSTRLLAGPVPRFCRARSFSPNGLEIEASKCRSIIIVVRPRFCMGYTGYIEGRSVSSQIYVFTFLTSSGARGVEW